MQKLADCCIFFLPGKATQSICADLLGILEEILPYGIGGLFTPVKFLPNEMPAQLNSKTI